MIIYLLVENATPLVVGPQQILYLPAACRNIVLKRKLKNSEVKVVLNCPSEVDGINRGC